MENNLKENVSHPKHYFERAGVECIKIAQTFNFNLGNAIKYIWRAGVKDKGKHIEDLRKAIQYLEFEIERIERT